MAEARNRDEADLEDYFRRRAIGIAVVTGAVALAGIGILHADAPQLFSGLLGWGLPCVLASAACGLAALVLLPRAAPAPLRVLAVGAVATVVLGWGVAQYPQLLGTHLTVQQAAAPLPTLVTLTVVAAAALVLVVPATVLLFVLQQRRRLDSPH